MHMSLHGLMPKGDFFFQILLLENFLLIGFLNTMSFFFFFVSGNCRSRRLVWVTTEYMHEFPPPCRKHINNYIMKSSLMGDQRVFKTDSVLHSDVVLQSNSQVCVCWGRGGAEGFQRNIKCLKVLFLSGKPDM